jgi:hypothetical protein
MLRYVPFLKFKQNEIQALGSLGFDINTKLSPFFDIPRTKQNQSELEIHERLDLGLAQLLKAFEKKGAFEFYIDNYDLDDAINLNGHPQYEYILSVFAPYRAIPVFAFDRSADHNVSALKYLEDVGGKVAVRLQLEDLESYSLTKKELTNLWPKLLKANAQEIHLIADARVINSPTATAQTIVDFLIPFKTDFSTQKIIATGSTIPANISELVGTGSSFSVPRQEVLTWKGIVSSPSLKDVAFGDYGVVSPDYSDAELDPRLLRLVSTPKAFYSYSDNFFVVRGSSFQTHPLGNGQYFLIAEEIEKQPFFRHPTFSYGEDYIFERSPKSAKKPPKGGTPGSWLKATLASHITYIA